MQAVGLSADIGNFWTLYLHQGGYIIGACVWVCVGKIAVKLLNRFWRNLVERWDMAFGRACKKLSYRWQTACVARQCNKIYR